MNKKPFNFKVLSQGGPQLNHGLILAEGKNVVVAQIDMKTKRATIDGYGRGDKNEPKLFIGANDDTLHLKEGLEGKWTEISFPDYPDFDCICAEISRYTLSLCLVKKD